MTANTTAWLDLEMRRVVIGVILALELPGLLTEHTRSSHNVRLIHLLYPHIWDRPRGGIMAYRGDPVDEP
jgi:hypothetical protein